MIRIVALHKEWKWKEQCITVLNEEWPKSVTWRNHSLEKSSDSFPCCLVLVLNDTEVLGHSKLSSVVGKPDACFVESVVIKKDKRGYGYGRVLMQKTEEYVLNIGIWQLYLTTHDKQDFYQHIGYQYCQPVVSMGNAAFVSSKTALKLFGSSSNSDDSKSLPSNGLLIERNAACATSMVAMPSITMDTQHKPSPASGDPCMSQPPPPPPLLPRHQRADSGLESAPPKFSSVWMMKQL